MIYDMYVELDFIASIGVEDGKLKIEGPEASVAREMIDEVLKGKSAEEVIKALPEHFHGVVHVMAHKARHVVKPD